MAVTLASWAKAKAMQLGFERMIGEQPEIMAYGNDYLVIDFTPEQTQKMIAFLDGQIQGILSRSEGPQPDVRVRLGKILIPWSTKYLVPVFLATFAMGYMSRAIVRPGRRR